MEVGGAENKSSDKSSLGFDDTGSVAVGMVGDNVSD